MSDRDSLALTPIVAAEELRERGIQACVGSDRIVLEVGFGRADLIMELASAEPARAFLGVEVSRKRVEKGGRRVTKRELENVHLVRAPAEYLLERVLPSDCVSECWINCPDPWPKKRHHRRRVIQPEFVRLLAVAMQPSSVLHISTDHKAYAEHIAEVLAASLDFRNLHAPAPWSDEPPPRPQTAYEKEWIADGRRIVYFDYARG